MCLTGKSCGARRPNFLDWERPLPPDLALVSGLQPTKWLQLLRPTTCFAHNWKIVSERDSYMVGPTRWRRSKCSPLLCRYRSTSLRSTRDPTNECEMTASYRYAKGQQSNTGKGGPVYQNA